MQENALGRWTARLARPPAVGTTVVLASVLSVLPTQTVVHAQRISAVKVSGTHRIAHEVITKTISSQVGNVWTRSMIQADIRALWRTEQFDRVAVEVEPQGRAVILHYVVRERPLLANVYVAGNKSVPLGAINRVLDLKKGHTLGGAQLKRNRHNLIDLYRRRGYYLARVDASIRTNDSGSTTAWYQIDEGNKVTVKRVSFVGNERIADTQLHKVVATKPGRPMPWLTGNGTFDATTVERDVLALESYYADRGFVSARVSPPTIKLSRDRRKMYVTFKVEEGNRYRIGDIAFTGTLHGSSDRHLATLGVGRGQIYRHSSILQGLRRVADLYRNEGYAHVAIIPHRELDEQQRIATLRFSIAPGLKVTIERITVGGNIETRDRVIRRELGIAEGDVYNHRRIEAARRRVTALGLFERVDTSTTSGSKPDRIVLNFEVVERPTGSFSAGVGASSHAVFGQLQAGEYNFLGRGQAVSVHGEVSSNQWRALLKFSEPRLFDSKWSADMKLFKTRLPFGLRTTKSTLGASVTLGRKLAKNTRGFVGLQRYRVSLDTTRVPLGELDTNHLFRNGTTSSIRAGLTWDGRNDRLVPTSGSYVSAFAEVADALTASDNRFVRYSGEANHYRSLWGPLTLRLRGLGGIATSTDPRGLPYTERYVLGGIDRIRGFAEGSLGPRLIIDSGPSRSTSSLSIGGNLQLQATGEIEFPVVKRLGLSGVAFLDAGNAYNLDRRFCNDSTNTSRKFSPCTGTLGDVLRGARVSAGFGIRWRSPLGPLRFEWGIPLDRQPGEKPIVFHFSIGGSF